MGHRLMPVLVLAWLLAGHDTCLASGAQQQSSSYDDLCELIVTHAQRAAREHNVRTRPNAHVTNRRGLSGSNTNAGMSVLHCETSAGYSSELAGVLSLEGS